MSLIIRQGMTGMEAAPVRRRHRDISWLFDQEASARKRAYELTDSFVQQPYAADHGHLRARVRGRADDVLSYQGVDIHPRVVRSVLVRSPEILGYQVRQTPAGIDLQALAVVRVDTDSLTGRLRKALAEAGLHHPAVTVQIVDHLQRNPETGKLRRFIPLHTPTRGLFQLEVARAVPFVLCRR